MCTAVTYQTKDFYMGRTLDYECSYGEELVITPRRSPFLFRHAGTKQSHYAILGMAHVAENTPLYYDALNECGLGMAGLNFVGNACYQEPEEGAQNVAQFELISWVLGSCASLEEARKLLEGTRVVGTSFSEQLPAAALHWMIADATGAVTVEAVAGGLQIYDNPVGVLTNNPPFPQQLFELNNYMSLSAAQPENRFCPSLPLSAYSRGMGAIGLPGDLSSASRFVRAAFTKLHAVSGEAEEDSVEQFFHILGAVEQPRGCCEVAEGAYEITIYTSCFNATKGIYYYTTYNRRRITAVALFRENLEGDRLIRYPVLLSEDWYYQNG